MAKNKSRQQKAEEYDKKYNHIPRDYNERLNYIIDDMNLSESKMLEILEYKSQMVSKLQYHDFNIILYELPEGTQRSRFRIVNRKNFANMAIKNPNFVHVYSPNAASDNNHMRRLVENELKEIDNISDELIATPCIIEINMFLQTPKAWSQRDIILSEIGLHRPIVKPDWDNCGKKYSDMYNDNIWLDDNLVIEGTVRKFYSILPRVEINLRYLNMLYNRYQYNAITNRKNFTENNSVEYFNL